MKKVLKRALGIGAIASIALAMPACHSTQASDAPSEETEQEVQVQFVNLQKEKPESTITLPGDLLPWEQTYIYAKVKGFVKDIYVDRGSVVKKGQLLALLEAPELTARLEQELSRVQKMRVTAKASKQYYHKLVESSKTEGAISLNELDLSKAAMEADSANLKFAEAEYKATYELNSYLKVTAPYDGTVSLKGVSPGALVGPDDMNDDRPLFVMEDAHKLRLTVAVPEKYATELTYTSKIRFTVDALPGKTYTAGLSRDANKIDKDVRSLFSEFDVPNPNGTLKPGMFAEVTIPIVRDEETFFIPRTALLNSTKGVFVITEKEGRANWVPVETGNIVDSKVEIFGHNLSENMKVADNVSEEIREGMPL